MTAHRRSPLRRALIPMLLVALGSTAPQAAGQLAPSPSIPGLNALEVNISGGRTLYSRTAYCGFFDAFLNRYDLTISRGALGASVGIVLDYPWPLPPPDRVVHLDRGGAIQAMAEVYPLRVIPVAREVERWVRPFVAAGVVVSRDGEAHPAGTRRESPVYAVQGRTDPGVSFGANLRIPLGAGPLGVNVQLRRTTLFSVEGELVSAEGQTFNTDSQNLSWNEVRLGVSFRP